MRLLASVLIRFGEKHTYLLAWPDFYYSCAEQVRSNLHSIMSLAGDRRYWEWRIRSIGRVALRELSETSSNYLDQTTCSYCQMASAQDSHGKPIVTFYLNDNGQGPLNFLSESLYRTMRGN